MFAASTLFDMVDNYWFGTNCHERLRIVLLRLVEGAIVRMVMAEMIPSSLLRDWQNETRREIMTHDDVVMTA